MKKILLLLTGVLFIFVTPLISEEKSEKENFITDKTISLLCSPDLYNLTMQWSNDYCKLNPGSNINLFTASSDQFSDIFKSQVNLCIISDGYLKSNDKSSYWKIVIGRDVIVPIINLNNPFIEAINKQGVTAVELVTLAGTDQIKNWGSLVENGKDSPVNFYLIQNESLKSGIAKYLQIDQRSIGGIEVNNGQDLVKAVQNDPYGIGFCRLTDIISSVNNDFVENIKPFPIDKNGNGKIDYIEKIYDNLNDFSKGIWIGKYPQGLISEIYSVSNGVPKNETEVAFLRWILTNGQQLLPQYGYSELAYIERQTKQDKLINPQIYTEPTRDNYAALKILLLVFIVIAAGGSLIILVFSSKRSKIKDLLKSSNDQQKVINENSITLPNGLYYDKTHTWAFMEKNGIVKVGIDDFLQHITGSYTRIKMKQPGDVIKRNEHLLTLVQDGKQLNIYAPFSGKIIDINENLVTNPSMINSSPYSDGWVYIIEPSNWLREIQFLQMVGKYKEWLKNEFLRVKDFLTTSVNSKSTELSYVTFQEGGELTDNILKDFGPEVWEDFQKNFIDTSELR